MLNPGKIADAGRSLKIITRVIAIGLIPAVIIGAALCFDLDYSTRMNLTGILIIGGGADTGHCADIAV